MRIAISGTHCSGKSTLAADFVAAHPGYAHEPEPYEWLEETEGFAETPSADDFHRQLELCVERLRSYGAGANVVFERSPMDFVAYLLALGRSGAGLIESATELASAGLEHLDLIAFTALNDRDPIVAPESEDLELREAVNERLVELYSGDIEVIEVRGSPAARLAALERAVALVSR